MVEDNDHARVRVPPPLIYLVFLAGAMVLNWAVPLSTPWTAMLKILGGLAFISGVGLVGSAFSQLAKQQTTIDPQGTTTVFVTRGPYRFTRNPIYLGFFLVYISATLVGGTLWGVIVSPLLLWTVTRVVIHAEESYLGAKFKEHYLEYKSRVRRWL